MFSVATFAGAARARPWVRYTRLRESNHRTTRITTTMTTMAMSILPIPPLCTVALSLSILTLPRVTQNRAVVYALNLLIRPVL